MTLSENVSENNAISTLKFIAWLNLIFCCICSLIIFLTWGSIEVQSRYSLTTYNEFNPVGISLGIALLIAGIVGWAFLLVVCSIARNLILISKNTTTIIDNFDNLKINKDSSSDTDFLQDSQSTINDANEKEESSNNGKEELSEHDKLNKLWLSGQISLSEFKNLKKNLD